MVKKGLYTNSKGEQSAGRYAFLSIIHVVLFVVITVIGWNMLGSVLQLFWPKLVFTPFDLGSVAILIGTLLTPAFGGKAAQAFAENGNSKKMSGGSTLTESELTQLEK